MPSGIPSNGKENKGRFVKGHKHSEETRKKLSEAHKGRKQSDETKRRKSEYMMGRKLPPAWRKSISDSRKGEKSHFWKGGVTNANKILRESMEYKMWRTSVFERDCYKCVFCGKNSKELNADHIKPFSLFPELRLNINNGRTLCKPCHKTTDTYGGRMLRIKK